MVYLVFFSRIFVLEENAYEFAAVLKQLEAKYDTYLIPLSLDPELKDSSGLSLFHLAAFCDDLNLIKRLVAVKRSVNEMNDLGLTPLSLAAHAGNTEMVEYLLSNGAHLLGGSNWSPLTIAAHFGHFRIVELLVDHGADVNIRTSEGLTPLIQASQNGHLAVVLYLLEQGAEVNVIAAKETKAAFALKQASQNGHLEVVKLLIQFGATINLQDLNGNTSVHVALFNEETKVLHHLIQKGAFVNLPNNDGLTPMMLAASKGEWKMVKWLIKQNLLINPLIHNPYQILKLAISSQNPHMVKFLLKQHLIKICLFTNDIVADTVRLSSPEILALVLKQSVNIDKALAKNRETPLHLAVSKGDLEMVKLLINRGSKAINSQNSHGITPLHYAAQSGHEEVVQFLLESGALTFAQDKMGKTPLHRAIKAGNANVIRMLLDYGACLRAKTIKGITPLHLAARFGDIRLCESLINLGAFIEDQTKNKLTPLHYAIKGKKFENFKYLLDEHRANTQVLDLERKPLLSFLFQNYYGDRVERKKFVNYLLTHHFDQLEIEDTGGKSPLHYAAQSASSNVLEQMLAIGATINTLDREGRTPLHYAKGSNVSVLVEHGAKVDEHKNGITPLFLAVLDHDYSKVANLLKCAADTSIGLIGTRTELLEYALRYNFKEPMAKWLNRHGLINTNLPIKVTPRDLAIILEQEFYTLFDLHTFVKSGLPNNVTVDAQDFWLYKMKFSSYERALYADRQEAIKILKNLQELLTILERSPHQQQFFQKSFHEMVKKTAHDYVQNPVAVREIIHRLKVQIKPLNTFGLFYSKVLPILDVKMRNPESRLQMF